MQLAASSLAQAAVAHDVVGQCQDFGSRGAARVTEVS
jgi:hypothetical protein